MLQKLSIEVELTTLATVTYSLDWTNCFTRYIEVVIKKPVKTRLFDLHFEEKI